MKIIILYLLAMYSVAGYSQNKNRYQVEPIKSGINQGDAQILKSKDNSKYLYEIGKKNAKNNSKKTEKKSNSNSRSMKFKADRIYLVEEGEIITFDFMDMYNAKAKLIEVTKEGYKTVIECVNVGGKKVIFTVVLDSERNVVGNTFVVGEEIVLSKGQEFHLTEISKGTVHPSEVN